MEAKERAEKLRLPLIVVVAETHDNAVQLSRDLGLADGIAVILSVPKTATEALQLLAQASQSAECPRIHIFPPAAATARGAQPIKLVGPAMSHAWRMTLQAGQVIPESPEAQQVLANNRSAASSWGNVQAHRRPQPPAASSPTGAAAAAQAAADNNNNNNNKKDVSSPVRADSAPSSQPSAAVVAPAAAVASTAAAAAGSSASSAAVAAKQDAAAEIPHSRLVPRCQVRVHPNSKTNTDGLGALPTVPRDKKLPEVRQLIADAARNHFGSSFYFLNGGDTVERVRGDDEHRLYAQDVAKANTLYIMPTQPMAPPTQVSADASSTVARTTAPAAAAASSSTAACGSVKMKISYTDTDSEVVTFPSTTTASEVADHIEKKMQHRHFFMQLPGGRIKDEDLGKTLAELKIVRTVAIRVYDINAQKEAAAKFDAELQADAGSAGSGGLGGLLSNIGGAAKGLFGRGSADGTNANKKAPAQDDTPPPTTTGAKSSAPKSMAEIRRAQDAEEERKKKAGQSDFYGGSGTNIEAPPDDKKK